MLYNSKSSQPGLDSHPNPNTNPNPDPNPGQSLNIRAGNNKRLWSVMKPEIFYHFMVQFPLGQYYARTTHKINLEKCGFYD